VEDLSDAGVDGWGLSAPFILTILLFSELVNLFKTLEAATYQLNAHNHSTDSAVLEKTYL
jgi:hypothetical protein